MPIPTFLQSTTTPTLEAYATLLYQKLRLEFPTSAGKIIFIPEPKIGFKRELDLRMESSLVGDNIEITHSNSEPYDEFQYEIQTAVVKVEAHQGKYLRRLSLNGFFRRLNANKMVLKAEFFSLSSTDTLSRESLEGTNDIRYVETTIQYERGFLEKAAVPSLTTLALGVMIYLFFSIRSN